jgi:hypothetical protein
MKRVYWMFWALILMLGFQCDMLAQDTIVSQAKSKKASSVKISKAASDLKESLDLER